MTNRKEGASTKHISVNVDGTQYEGDVEPRTLLVHWLREELGEAACAQAADGLQPFADEDADVEFRKHLVSVLTKRAIATAAGISS